MTMPTAIYLYSILQRRSFSILVLVFLSICNCNAQSWKSDTRDDILQKAREKSYDPTQREEAIQMIRHLIEMDAQNYDARILLARIYAWNQEFDNARDELRHVLRKRTDNGDAKAALIDVELWSKNFQSALALIEKELEIHPKSEELLFKKAQAFVGLQRQDEAIASLNYLLHLYPAHQEGFRLLQHIKLSQLQYFAGVNYQLDIFDRTLNPAHYESLHVGSLKGWGTFIARLNLAERFGTSGIQPEIEVYPKISKGFYGYFNYGYSNSILFPEHRMGAELFSILPKEFEASVGVRYLISSVAREAVVYTGSVSRYIDDYYLSLRSFITANGVTGPLWSGNVLVRRYFSNADHYIALAGGLGYSPEERRFQSGSGLTSDQIFILKSQRITLSWSQALKHNFVAAANFDLTRQEVAFEQNIFITAVGVGLSLKKRF
ncbi:MAG TPA: YaiO family outer membrane beta-barrel protein [Chryseosolibacter sp.]|nr:YaiO family outer membrane beta-barrel protein [Chryseosolibacter sp.]